MGESCQTRRMFGHNYAVPGTYEVTIVVAGRQPVFGEIIGTSKTVGDRPRLKPSKLGQIVLDNEIPKIHHYYPMVEVWQVCLMPDHLHMIVRINQPLPKGKHLGIILGAFKGGISRAWWVLKGTVANATATVATTETTTRAATGETTGAATGETTGAAVGIAMGKATVAMAGAAMGATVSAASAAEQRTPLFEPNYNDHILMRDGQLANWKRYLRDNPLRYIMRREYPNLFQRALCVTIGGVRYSAFGNMLLRRQPEKHQVFFHRRTNGIPTEDTDFWRTESQQLISAANSGDVLVTPGVSECEKRIKNMALKQRLRLIHLQAEPISKYWKPELSCFEACAYGSLLILAPWPEDMPIFSSNYEQFHYLNQLAKTICSIGAETQVTVQGLRLAHNS